MKNIDEMSGAKREDPTPIYYRLQKDLRHKIEDGKWSPGEAIPSARKMADELGVSLGTVQKAVENLVNEGFLFRIQGKGTFVSGTTIRRESLRYIRMRKDFRDYDTAFKIKVMGIETVPASQPANRYLKIDAEDELYRLERVFVSRRGPISYNVTYLPAKMFPDFVKSAAPRLEKFTLYETVEELYGLPTISNMELFAVAFADAQTADALAIEKGAPLLKTEMLSLTYKRKPYEYRTSYCLTGGDSKLFRELV